ncbi:hypothetical protein M8J75_013221 [Diaphorina citri]|nr:hypothetical protein M8J75_013221 [Diaphorina citri]
MILSFVNVVGLVRGRRLMLNDSNGNRSNNTSISRYLDATHTLSLSGGLSSDCLSDGLSSDCVSDGLSSDCVSDGLSSDCVSDGLSSDCVSDGLSSDCVSDGLSSDCVSDGLSSDCVSDGLSSDCVSDGLSSDCVSDGLSSDCVSDGLLHPGELRKYPEMNTDTTSLQYLGRLHSITPISPKSLHQSTKTNIPRDLRPDQKCTSIHSIIDRNRNLSAT